MKIEVVIGDITTLNVDAIVNAANPALVAGGGVCGAIHRVAGPELEQECLKMHPLGCHTGGAVGTDGYGLPSKYCIHAVGPKWYDGNHGEEVLLSDAYEASVEIADAMGANTVAFPVISSGIYGYPLAEACYVAVRALRRAEKNGSDVTRVVFAVLDERVAETLRDMIHAMPSPFESC